MEIDFHFATTYVVARLSGFEQTNWARFHQALQAHQEAILHEILPAFGICVN